MRWQLEVLKQALFARIPFGATLRKLKRRQFGYAPDPANLLGTLSDLERMKSALTAVGRSFKAASVMEIGSGWFPTIPIMLAVSGARHVLMTDRARHMDRLTFDATLRFLKGVFPDNARLSAVARVEDLPISYLVPFRAQEVADSSIDVIVSRTVLEHVPASDLVRLLKDLRPMLASDGLMVHIIDNSDHLEHCDKSISRINFLTWSEAKHAFINSLMRGGENRLRHHEYRGLFASAGLQVIHEAVYVDDATRRRMQELTLMPPYSIMSAEQLAALISTYVLAPMTSR